MTQSQQHPAAQQARLTHVDRPEISETFADSMWGITFENMLVKMEFTVNRMDDPNPPSPPAGRATTACRIVMPFQGMVDMLAKLQGL